MNFCIICNGSSLWWSPVRQNFTGYKKILWNTKNSNNMLFKKSHLSEWIKEDWTAYCWEKVLDRGKQKYFPLRKKEFPCLITYSKPYLFKTWRQINTLLRSNKHHGLDYSFTFNLKNHFQGELKVKSQIWTHLFFIIYIHKITFTSELPRGPSLCIFIQEQLSPFGIIRPWQLYIKLK